MNLGATQKNIVKNLNSTANMADSLIIKDIDVYDFYQKQHKNDRHHFDDFDVTC